MPLPPSRSLSARSPGKRPNCQSIERREQPIKRDNGHRHAPHRPDADAGLSWRTWRRWCLKTSSLCPSASKIVRIAAYITPRGFVNATGQGKHAMNMSRALLARDDVDVTLMACRDQFADRTQLPEGTGLVHAKSRWIPFPARLLHFVWRMCSQPPADLWCSSVDWVYSPTEQFVPARRAKTAATIHCVNWFERDLPWSATTQNQLERRRMERVFSPIIHRADLIVTVSEFLKGRICALFGTSPERIVVVGNGAEECFYQTGRQSQMPQATASDGPFLLAIAYPTQRKGFHYLIQVADALAGQRSDLRIRIAGTGLGPGETLAIVERRWGSDVASLLGAALERPNVELLGYMQKEELASLLRKSVAFLILSRYETFGIPVVEAMAAGTPVIAARFAALPEVVGDAGVLVDAGAPGDVARTAMDFAASASLRQQYITAGRKRAAEFTWDKCAARLVAALGDA